MPKQRSVTDPTQYEITVAGALTPQWAGWFNGLSVVLESDNETILCGPVADQAALHGLLARIRDLGLTLLAVRRIEGGE